MTDGARRAISIGSGTVFGFACITNSVGATTLICNAGSFLEIYGLWIPRGNADAALDSFKYVA